MMMAKTMRTTRNDLRYEMWNSHHNTATSAAVMSGNRITATSNENSASKSAINYLSAKPKKRHPRNPRSKSQRIIPRSLCSMKSMISVISSF